MQTHEKNVRMYRPCESVAGNICIPYVDDNLVITYNFLNLPKEIKKSGTVVSKYTYLSDGSKVSSCNAGGNGYMYFGTARFTLDNNVPTFESIPFSSGRIVKTTNGYEPQYYLTDHLGSTRMIVNKDGQTVEATFDYTPFGVQITGASLPTNSTEYRFSGKELQNISDYEIYDFGARQYFPKYAIWSSVDPLSEKYYPITPYAYCVNNPIKFIDPDGNKLVSANGHVLWNTDPKKGNIGWTPAGKSSSYYILRRHLTELQKTVTGKQQFDKLVTSDLPITIAYGRLENDEYGITKTSVNLKSGVRKNAQITIDTENNKRKASDNGITLDQSIASTLGHEIRHTEQENFEMQTNTPANTEYLDMQEEKDAHEIGNRIIQDYKNGNYYKEKRTNFMDTIIDCFNKLFK